MTIFLKWRKRF